MDFNEGLVEKSAEVYLNCEDYSQERLGEAERELIHAMLLFKYKFQSVGSCHPFQVLLGFLETAGFDGSVKANPNLQFVLKGVEPSVTTSDVQPLTWVGLPVVEFDASGKGCRLTEVGEAFAMIYSSKAKEIDGNRIQIG